MVMLTFDEIFITGSWTGVLPQLSFFFYGAMNVYYIMWPLLGVQPNDSLG